MDAWLIVLITISSGLAFFILLFCIKLRKNKRREAMRSAAYSATMVVQPTQVTYPQNSNQQMPYPPQDQMPYPAQQQMPYPAQQQLPYPAQHQNQQIPLPYPAQHSSQYQQQSNYPAQTQAMSFVPSTNNQPLFNPQNPQQYYPPPGIIVSTAPYNPSPSVPPVNRY